ncbi:diaminopimelate epimerase [Aurantivibrio plasticivorans]
MRLRFTKMHGLGNDFVVIDAITQQVRLTPEKIRALADRHFGVGCDQVLLVEPPTQTDVDFRYRIYNQDGGEVQNCGNGARCFAKFVSDRRLTGKRAIRVETANGLMTLHLQANGDVSVDMGVPVLSPSEIPFLANSEQQTYALALPNQDIELSAVSMGNPHAVIVVEDVATAPVETLGKAIQRAEEFPEGVNVGFMEVLSRGEIRLRVLERGVGETLACGTGACAAVVAGQLRGLLDNEVTVTLPGGVLHCQWQGPGTPVIKTGPATTVFQGQVRI